MKEHSLKDLGTLVHLFMKGNHPNTAQIFLNEMQARVNAAATMPGVLETKPGWEEKPLAPASDFSLNEILEELPMVETTEPKLEHKTLLEVAQDTESKPVLEPKLEHNGPLRDDQGRVTRVSVLAGTSGYDSTAHDNKDLKIFCGGTHIPTAHTADTEMGIVWYYEKNERGRIKTKELHGKVEIRGYNAIS